MLAHKAISHALVVLPNEIHRPVLRALGFPQGSAPAVAIEGARLQGTMTIARALDALQPHNPLFPSDSELRARVTQAETWGHDVLQLPARLLSFSSLLRHGSANDYLSYFDERVFGLPRRLAPAIERPLLAISARRLGARRLSRVRAAVLDIPELIDKVDWLIEQGTIGAEEPNAADFQIAPSVRMFMRFEDLRPLVIGRPAESFARRVMPGPPWPLTVRLPAEWLSALSSKALNNDPSGDPR